MFYAFYRWKTCLYSGNLPRELEISWRTMTIEPTLNPTAWFLLWKFAELFPYFLTISPPFAMAAEAWTLVYVMRELPCAIAVHQHFGTIPPWKLGFLLSVRKSAALQSKLEGRIFSQGGKTELFSSNVLKGQLSLISLQIPFGFLTACQSSKENAL